MRSKEHGVNIWMITTLSLLAIRLLSVLVGGLYYSVREPTKGLPITDISSSGYCGYGCDFSWLVEDDSGNVYAVMYNQNVIHMGTNEHPRLYHLEMFEMPLFNTSNGIIQVFSEGVVYEYTQDGDYLNQYPSESFSELKPANWIEHEGRVYGITPEVGQWIRRVDAYDAGQSGERSTVLWTISGVGVNQISALYTALLLVSCFMWHKSKHYSKS